MLNGKKSVPHIYPFALIDLNTQGDLFDPDGATPVVFAEGMRAPLRRVVAWMRRNRVPVVSSMQTYRMRDVQPDRCIAGTPGQNKVDYTLLPDHIYIAGDNTLAIETNLFRKHQQVIFPQRSQDLFANPKADRFLTQVRVEHFFVFGALCEQDVKTVTLGLLARAKKVSVISDACGCWNQMEADLALRQMQAKGAGVLTIDELVERRVRSRWFNGERHFIAERKSPLVDPQLLQPKSNGTGPTDAMRQTG